MDLKTVSKECAKDEISQGGIIGIEYRREIVLYRLIDNELMILGVIGNWIPSHTYEGLTQLIECNDEFIIY
jgi:hypothetical protein